jgi:hypothetical protein
MNSSRRAPVVAAVAVTAVIFTAAAVWIASAITGSSLCLVVQEGSAAAPQRQLTKGDVVAPLQDLDLTSGDWSAYILLDPADFRELKGKLPRNCLKLTDRQEIKRLQRDLKARYMGADVATVTSRLIFLRDGKLVFDSGIVLDGQGLKGIQTRSWGWLSFEGAPVASDFSNRFRPVYWPIVLL